MSLPTVHAAATYFGVRFEDLIGPSRKMGPLRARAAVVHVMRIRDGQPYTMIARRLGRGDHKSMIGAMQKAEWMLVRDPDFARFVDAQLALPRHSPVAAILPPVKRAKATPPAPKPKRRKPPVVVPQFITSVESSPDPERETIKLPGCQPFSMTDGATPDERKFFRNVAKGSRLLAQALRAARAA